MANRQGEPEAGDLWAQLRRRVGWRPVIDASAPTVAFIAAFVASGLLAGVLGAVAAAAVLCAIRLWRREGVRPALITLAVLLLAALLVHRTGQGVNLFLPDLIINTALAVWFAVSLVVRRPATAAVLRIVGIPPGDLATSPALLRGHLRATAVWLTLWCVHLGIELPLYLAHDTLGLAIVRVALGPPMWVPVAWIGWRLIRRSVRRSAAGNISPGEPAGSA
jgi:hypothetical protein